MAHLATVSTLTRWEVLVGLVTGVLAIVGTMWRSGRKLARDIIGLVETIKNDSETTSANTIAIHELTAQFGKLTDRLEHVEGSIGKGGRRR